MKTRDDDMDPQALVSVKKKMCTNFFYRDKCLCMDPKKLIFFALYAFLKMLIIMLVLMYFTSKMFYVILLKSYG